MKADKQRWELRSPLHWFENHDFRRTAAPGWSSIRRTAGSRRMTPKARERAAARAAGAPGTRRGRLVRGPQPLRPLHHPRPPRVDDAGDLRQLVRDRAGPGLRRDPLRDGQRAARHPAVDRRPHVGTDDPLVHGRRARPLRGHDAGRRDDELSTRVAYRGSSERLRLIERFTPVAPGIVEWSITLDDPDTWARPWTFAMNLTQDERSRPSSTPATKATTRCSTC